MLSHVLIADTHSDAGPDWRLSDEFFPGSAEGSLAELPAQALSRGESAAQERLIFVARLERNETHCVPSAEHCAVNTTACTASFLAGLRSSRRDGVIRGRC